MSQQQILVLGIGNLLYADEGFGVRCVERFMSHYRLPEQVSAVDGGTLGLMLVQEVRKADVLVIFDAIDYGLEPGTIKLISNDDVPKYMGAKKVSLHQTGFQEVLSLAEFAGEMPQELYLIGVQPQIIEDYGGSLSEPVRAQVEPAINHAIEFLAERGITIEKLDQPIIREELGHQSIDISNYEAGRPSADKAFRMGDERFLPTTSKES